MPLRPYSRGLSRFRREPVKGAVKKMGLPWDAYYVLTKAEARLTNSKIHPNSGAPDYDITHNLSDLTIDQDLNVGAYSIDMNGNDIYNTNMVRFDAASDNALGFGGTDFTFFTSHELGDEIEAMQFFQDTTADENYFYMRGDIGPQTDNFYNLIHDQAGETFYWKDLGLKGNLTDGTNVLTVANAKTAFDHVSLTNNPHSTDYAGVSGADAATDVTAVELEELTDASETILHSHAAAPVAVSLDDAYNEGATITVDDKDVIWNLTSTYDFKVQDNGSDLFLIENDGEVKVIAPAATTTMFQADGTTNRFPVTSAGNKVLFTAYTTTEDVTQSFANWMFNSTLLCKWSINSSSNLTGTNTGFLGTISDDTQFEGSGNHTHAGKGFDVFANCAGNDLSTGDSTRNIYGGYYYGYYAGTTFKSAGTATVDVYGIYSRGRFRGALAAGTLVGTSYGGYFWGQGVEAGTTKAYGVYATATGADTNYAAWFDGTFVVNGISYLGDGGTTDYTEIATDGDLTFVGNAGLSFGDIYGLDETITCTTQNTWYQITFDTAGPSNSTTVSAANNDITIIAAGAYKIGLTVCCHSAVAHDFEVMVKKNNGTVDIVCMHLFQSTAVANQVENISGNCIASLAQGDTIEAWVQCTDAAGIPFIIDHCDLNLVQVGGT